ncbi:neutral/alkaline non-lysosomal ceramidase N-terminal domain-containing protein [Nocardioides sp. GCM10027113]|uniref:neutral/alkaline non-lysosomal ceramidase N-terminal domain-containing protein n=1 Tax=unclassified Nocardioides TaxID=2615069 RepID=UPI0036224394
MRPRIVAALVAAVLLATGVLTGSTLPGAPSVTASAAADDRLRVGVGRADLTPPTGYFTMGNVRSDARATGQHTRLQARAVVLERGGEKVALVVADLCCVAGGLLTEAARMLEGHGIDETRMVVAATHTHSAPGQYFPFAAYDVTFPNVPTATQFSVQPDPQLYGFLARRIAEAVARADDDLGPGAAAWGRTQIPVGLTENRSIEAHLANYGIERDLAEGSAAESPRGAGSTIDPDVDVLRVDKWLDGRLVPVGMWSTFANHGTVVLGSRAHSYNGDHSGAAMLASEQALRELGDVPPGQEVVSAFSNGAEGDTSSALHRSGPAAAEYVGRVEAAAILRAWRSAGSRLTTTPELDVRWTRFCFCGQSVGGGRVDDKAVPGLPLLTGSDEHRGQLHENSGAVFEGHRLPAGAGPQGNKIQLEPQGVPIPVGAPLAVVRVGDGVVVSNPGEVTVEVGRRIEEAVATALAGSGVDTVAISGLANEYQGYFTTPEEYAWQAYEGGQTNFGTHSSVLLVQETARLARTLASGEPAPPAYPFDPTNGMEPDHTPFPEGAAAGAPVSQPGATRRLDRASFKWRGGPRGTDRPLDGAFVTVERRTPGGWEPVADDLGTRIAWSVEGDEQVPLGPRYVVEAREGTYTAAWEVPLDAPAGRHRFVVTANRYELASEPFRVGTGRILAATPVRAGEGRAAFVLSYPEAEPYTDLTWRPQVATGGPAVRVRVDGRRVTVAPHSAGVYVLAAPEGARVVVPRGTVGDPYGNTTSRRTRFVAGSAIASQPTEQYPLLSPW